MIEYNSPFITISVRGTDEKKGSILVYKLGVEEGRIVIIPREDGLKDDGFIVSITPYWKKPKKID